ncbi:hypothetical protein LTR36_008133 [Oleoguttula mirabilis]|uniref:Uncharacterized protein n=1 Tax=Oleoguttula mirabilis TaxID=1507867 RepID=A0AAV9J936_9PEZI|nr:hypothetical protein LTR36_008133 [Oleoguttula mirabilis]
MLASRAARASLFHLPPPLRVATYHQSRAFSASAPRNFTLVDIAVAGPSALVDSLHNTGLPWYATLPTAAVLVRGVLVYYLSALPARRAARVQANLVPLASARTLHKLNDANAQARLQKLPPSLRPLSRMIRGYWFRSLELHKLGKLFGAPRFHPRGILNFGMLIAFTEAIRIKCGSREGLLPLVLSPFEWVAMQTMPGQFPTVAPPEPSGLGEEQLQAATTVSEDGMTSIDLSQLRVAQPGHAHSAHLDPTLTDEGLFWCLDLTAPDPTFLLPTLLSLTMAANIIFRPTAGKPKASSPAAATPRALTTSEEQIASPEARKILQAPPAQGILSRYIGPMNFGQRIGLCISIVFFFAALKMPAAILLYFIPSMIMGGLQRMWLDRKVPITPPIQPCRRPLRFKVRKEWVD